MSNIIDYLKEYSHKTFKQHPFTAVDALLLSQISYLKLQNLVPIDGFVILDAIEANPMADSMFTDRIYGERYREIMGYVIGSKRYAGFEIGLFHDTYSELSEFQFAAVTIKMGQKGANSNSNDGLYFVSFRGTDERLAGWKEDFNIGHMGIIPSEKMALEYLLKLPKMLEKSGMPEIQSLFIGGHSKGGAQAVYAASMASEQMQKKISGVYSFDGVGLGEEFYKSKEYKRIKALTTKIIPDESIVGMLFENQSNCIVIESDGHGIKQHDYSKWIVEKGQFKYCDGLKPVAIRLAERINRWMESMELREREDFVDIIYGLILDCNPEDIYNMGDEIPSKIKCVISSLKTMSKEDREEITSALKKLL